MQRAEVQTYVIAAALGAVAMVLVGYMVFAAPGDTVSFGYWLNRPMLYGVWQWAIVGLLVGAGLNRVIRR